MYLSKFILFFFKDFMLPTSDRWDLSQDLRNTMRVLAKQSSPTKMMKSFQRREREKISNGERSQQIEENEENDSNRFNVNVRSSEDRSLNPSLSNVLSILEKGNICY